tara:strand:+ start:463 stop:627 length:165 start_codon:yes stop_codon:yes gene_type:complete
MSLFDLALTKGAGNPFDALTLARVAAQTKKYQKPIVTSLYLIPLAIIAFLVLKK